MAKRKEEEEVQLPPVYSGVKSLDIDQTLRENVQWALEAAGLKHRTGRDPTECPNDQAYFMFLEACERPKDFFAKFSQIESKAMDSTTFRRDCQKNTEELSAMIDEIRYLDNLPSFLR
uniref:Uncharacterized protein n=1 Tax=viral metagenome TaxID=1070528 RepID=A0A6M3LMN1_9ZZZZ